MKAGKDMEILVLKASDNISFLGSIFYSPAASLLVAGEVHLFATLPGEKI